MAREVAYCDSCGNRVLGEDAQPEAAVQDRTYCRGCLPETAKKWTVDSITPSRRRETTSLRRPQTPRPPALTRPSRCPLLGIVLITAGVAGAGLLLWDPARPGPASHPSGELTFVPAAPKPLPHAASFPPAPAPEKSTEPPAELPTVKPPPPKPDPREQARAKELHDEITEACQVLGDEGRFDDAIQLIETFPSELRHLDAWQSLEGLKRQVEQRRKSGLPRKVPR